MLHPHTENCGHCPKVALEASSRVVRKLLRIDFVIVDLLTVQEIETELSQGLGS